MLQFGQRTRVDLKVSAGHHFTRVKKPSEQDWRKFKCLTGHVWSTRFILLTLTFDENGNIVMHADGSHAVHNHGKGQLGLFITMVKGAMTSASKKLGIVTKAQLKQRSSMMGKHFLNAVVSGTFV